MSASPATHAALHRLRFVFRDSAPLLHLVPHVTSGDIARIWNDIADRYPDPPVAIDVTFATREDATPAMTPASTARQPVARA